MRKPKTKILIGDVMDKIKEIPDRVIQVCICSPPYWALRDYGTEGQLGLEKTPEEYIEKMVKIFREVKRVLRDDGTLWLNIGDTYAGGGNNRGNNSPLSDKQASNKGATGQCGEYRFEAGVPDKNLCGIPWRVALALQADGWWLRSDNIWDKKNPMPSSASDRPGVQHEYIFLLTKSPRYFYDDIAVRIGSKIQSVKTPDGWDTGEGGHGTIHRKGREKGKTDTGTTVGRNLRTVWSIPTQGFPDAHFATMPTKVVVPCVKAGSSEKGCCSKCRAPIKRIVDKKRVATRPGKNNVTDKTGKANRDEQRHVTEMVTIGWEPTCNCDTGETIPCLVFDPFLGSGTTAAVAVQYGRDAVGIELNPEYVELAKRRIKQHRRMRGFGI